MGRKKKEEEALPAVIDPENEERQALLTQIEGDLPYERTLYINEARRYIKRSVEDIMEAGKFLLVIQAREGHGNFVKILEEDIGIPHSTAYRFMKAAAMNGKFPKIDFSQLGKMKALLLMEAPEEELNKFEQLGLFAGKTMDEIDLMTTAQLRAEVRRLKEGKESREIADLRLDLKAKTAQLDEYDRKYHKAQMNWLDLNRKPLREICDTLMRELKIFVTHKNMDDNDEARLFIFNLLRGLDIQVKDLDAEYKKKSGLSFTKA